MKNVKWVSLSTVKFFCSISLHHWIISIIKDYKQNVDYVPQITRRADRKVAILSGIINSIRFSFVSDDVEEIDRAVQVAAIGRAFVLLVLPERTVLLRE